ncbi:hypothetical protein HZC07_03835 [Candidatus Micrarchaeota archaeon]|nr:hypothetical protein [Candidatus Micrarchaeota archaeon]
MKKKKSFQFHIPELGTGVTAVGILIAIMLFAGFFVKPPAVLKYTEEPLVKNTQLQIKPGETYVYQYMYNNSSANISYQVLDGGDCTIIRMVESVNISAICIDSGGVDRTGSNMTFANPSMILFKPWMLAVKEGWNWNVSVYMDFNDSKTYIATVYYMTVRTENYNGRKTFVVEERTGSDSQYDWIDAEKRVLLRIVGKGYEIIGGKEN